MSRALLLLLLTCTVLQAEESLVVVVSQQSPIQQLSREDLSALYLGNLMTNETTHNLRALDLTDGETRDNFYTYLLGRSRNQMRAYWSRMVFTGKGKPPRALDEAAIIEALQSDPSLIAYLPSGQLPASLRPLLNLP